MKFKNQIFLTLSSWLLPFNFINAQVGLVANGSFEDTLTCSSNMFALHQLTAINWFNYNTVDYYNNTTYCPYGTGGGGGSFPWNLGGYQYPHSGNAYTGIVTYLNSNSKGYREWLQSKLIDTLVSGRTYCVSFYYSEGNSTKYAIDRIGVYFSSNGVNLSASSFIQYNPQITTPSGQFLNDTLNWKQFKTNYTALGSELFITLGNFFDSVQINTQLYPNNPTFNALSYYYIDDVSLIPIDLAPWAGRDTSITLGDSVYIGRPNEVGLNDDCTWYVLGNATSFATIAGMWIKPNTLGVHSYLLKQNICGTITYDTVKVIVNPVGVETFKSQNFNFKIYPNPTKGNIELNAETELGLITIYNTLGDFVYQQKAKGRSAQIDLTPQPPGIYILRVQNKFLKIVKE